MEFFPAFDWTWQNSSRRGRHIAAGSRVSLIAACLSVAFLLPILPGPGAFVESADQFQGVTSLSLNGCAWAKRSAKSKKTRAAAKRSKSARQSGRKSGRGSRRERQAERRSSRGRKRHGEREKHASARERRRGRGHKRAHERAEKAAKEPPPKPSAEQLQAIHQRESAYQLMSRAYKLYDLGINARLAGNYPEAVAKLSEAWKLFNDARDYQRTGESSMLEALVHFELGQAFESDGDTLSARDSYVRCLNIRPSVIDASIHLVNMLARVGQWQLALAKADEAARANPNDPRAHLLLSLALSKTGHPTEAQAENEKAKELLKAHPHYKPYGIDNAYRKMQNEAAARQAQGAGEPSAQEGQSGAQSEAESSKSGSQSTTGESSPAVDKEQKKGGDLSNVMGDDGDSDEASDKSPPPPSKDNKDLHKVKM